MTIEEKKVDKEAESVWAKFAYTASDGKTYQVDYYNLDVIISVGYRVKSVQGTKFRIWATSVLRQYLLQGYSVNRHLIALQENMDKRMTHIEDTQAKHNSSLISLFEPPLLQQKWSSSKVISIRQELLWRTWLVLPIIE